MSDSQERIRLVELYRSMNDGQLEKLAAEVDELSDVARTALADELVRRGVHVQDSLSEAQFESDANEELNTEPLVTIRKYRDLGPALLAKGSLESAGIPCFLLDENMVRMDWFISNLLGGVKLQVRPEDMDAALSLLDQPIPESFEVEGQETFEQPRCPKCNSVDISYPGINKPVAFASAYFSVPIPLPSDTWTCETCGAKWTNTESPEGR